MPLAERADPLRTAGIAGGNDGALRKRRRREVRRHLGSVRHRRGPRNHYGLGVLTGDYDNDGRPDVYVACDSTASLLYRNKGDGAFEELGLFSGAAYNEDGQEQAGMGVAAGDYDGDGLTDIFKTNFASDTNTLYRNNGDFSFTDETVAAGLATVTQYVGWGSGVPRLRPRRPARPVCRQRTRRAQRGRRADRRELRATRGSCSGTAGTAAFIRCRPKPAPAVAARHSSRGAAAGDLDNDGDLEIVVVNMNEAPSLLQNFGPAGNWLLVRALASSGRDEHRGPRCGRRGGANAGQGNPQRRQLPFAKRPAGPLRPGRRGCGGSLDPLVFGPNPKNRRGRGEPLADPARDVAVTPSSGCRPAAFAVSWPHPPLPATRPLSMAAAKSGSARTAA